jgi:glycosyltransferase involved in cell wall biosynthesis
MRQKPALCFVSSIPMTLWIFYRLLIARLLRDGYTVTILSSPMHPLDEFERMGCSTVPIRITRTISPWQDILSLIKLFRYFRKFKPSIVHAHTPKGGLLAMIAAAMAGVRCRLYTCHGLVSETETGLKRLLLTLSERLTFALAHRILVVSLSLSRKLTEHHIGSEAKKMILGNGTACGLDVTTFDRTPELIAQARQIRDGLKISSEAIVIGFIGRLVPDKGIHLLVDAFSELYRENDRVRLLIVGDAEPHRGVLPDKTLRLIEEHVGIRRVGFTHKIERYYACMDLLALPTRREGFNYALLEAAAMQIPAIATRVTGCVDAIVDDKTGILVEPDNTLALLAALRRLVNDPTLRMTLGRAARKRVEEEYRVETMIEHHMNLYDQSIHSPGKPVQSQAVQDSN